MWERRWGGRWVLTLPLGALEVAPVRGGWRWRVCGRDWWPASSEADAKESALLEALHLVGECRDLILAAQGGNHERT